METSNFDEKYLVLFEKHINTLNLELEQLLSDANDRDFVRNEFIEKCVLEFNHYTAFIPTIGRRTDQFKWELTNLFTYTLKIKLTAPVTFFFENKLPQIKTEYLQLKEKETDGQLEPSFDYDFFEHSDNESLLDFFARYVALAKFYPKSEPNNPEKLSGGFGNMLNDLTQIQRALFFYYIQTCNCYPLFGEFNGKSRIEAIEETFKKLGITAMPNEFNNQHYRIIKKEERITDKNIKNIKAVIPLLIACPKAMELAREELKLCELKL